MHKLLPWLTVIALIGVLAWSFFYLRDIHPLGALSTKVPRQGISDLAIEFHDVELIGWKHGRRAWRFHAGKVGVSKDRRLAVLEGQPYGIMVENGVKIASLSSDKIVYNIDSRNVSVPGTAEISIVDGPEFKAEKAYWNNRKQKLISGAVDAVFDGHILHGEKLEADVKNKVMTVSKVSGVLTLTDE